MIDYGCPLTTLDSLRLPSDLLHIIKKHRGKVPPPLSKNQLPSYPREYKAPWHSKVERVGEGANGIVRKVKLGGGHLSGYYEVRNPGSCLFLLI